MALDLLGATSHVCRIQLYELYYVISVYLIMQPGMLEPMPDVKTEGHYPALSELSSPRGLSHYLVHYGSYIALAWVSGRAPGWQRRNTANETASVTAEGTALSS